MITKHLRIALAVPVLAFANPLHASCGSAFCMLNTDWTMQETSGHAGETRLDLRYEFIRQDRLYSGSHSIPASQDTGDTTELHTYNRNLLATLNYNFSPRLGMSISLPVVSRTHAHIADPTGAAANESWRFTKAGDTSVLGRYRLTPGNAQENSYGLQFGLKLPTGDYQVSNAEGTRAERAMQPGSGSTDLIVGGYYSYRPRLLGTGWFVQGFYQSAVATRDNFRPGSQLSVTGGARHPYSDKLTGLFQLNAQVKQRDSGQNAEPDLSGGKFLYASPGLNYQFSPGFQAYGFIQLPLYRYVEGTQLSADWSLIGGISYRF